MKLLNFLLNYWEGVRVTKMTKEELKQLQLKKFRKLVKHAIINSPFYRDLYLNAGITEKDVDSIFPNQLPLTNKAMLMDNFDSAITNKNLKYAELKYFISNNKNYKDIYKNSYIVLQTSGSTGFPAIYPYPTEEFMTMRSLALGPMLDITPGKAIKRLFQQKRHAFYGAAHGHFAGVTLIQSLPSNLCNCEILSVLTPISEIVARLNEYQPHIIFGYSSAIRRLAEKQLEGKLHISPEKILCSGDPLYDSTRKIIQEAFKVNPINVYSTTEALNLARQETPDDESLIVFDHMYHLDLVDDKVCLCNLYYYTLPLIRYQLEDCIEKVENHNSKLPFSRIKLKNARILDILKIINNEGELEEIHPIALVAFTTDGLDGVQFWQKTNDRILIKAKGKGDQLAGRVKEVMMDILRQRKAEKRVKIDVELVNSFQTDEKTGKFKLINAA